MRWWIFFGVPFLFAAACLGAALATLDRNAWITPLLFSGVIVLPVLWGYAITHWALANDANANPHLELAGEESHP